MEPCGKGLTVHHEAASGREAEQRECRSVYTRIVSCTDSNWCVFCGPAGDEVCSGGAG